MSSKRILSVVEDIENSASIAKSDLIDTLNSDSDSSDISLLVRKRCKRLIIEDDTDDEDHSNHQQSELWIWKEETNDPKIWNYTEIPGIKVAILSQLGENKKELDFFNIIFDNIFWENIVTETNQYANQIMNNENKRLKIDKTWFPVDSGEIKIYFALCIIMAEVKKPTIQMNWSKKAVIETPIFRKTMPFKRFLQITRCLHFSDNNSVNNTDKLCKIKPVINFFNQRFKEVYTMQENITIDESLMKYKGHLSYKQFNPSEGCTRTEIICQKIFVK
uniref:piggyBac transposable element-derived protein 4-like n=1 Tax=Bombus vancouverensis nearcticus TaxID=2705178 RepID=UPI00143B388E|nr:piggyBac transposable element-derived protein 4-like [Bombus vancouverensis nearcticus]